jgi:hypothetical protein
MTFVQGPERQYDIHIMDYVIQCGLFTEDQIRTELYFEKFTDPGFLKDLQHGYNTQKPESL